MLALENPEALIGRLRAFLEACVPPP
jgi:hypothetical protein